MCCVMCVVVCVLCDVCCGVCVVFCVLCVSRTQTRNSDSLTPAGHVHCGGICHVFVLVLLRMQIMHANARQ